MKKSPLFFHLLLVSILCATTLVNPAPAVAAAVTPPKPTGNPAPVSALTAMPTKPVEQITGSAKTQPRAACYANTYMDGGFQNYEFTYDYNPSACTFTIPSNVQQVLVLMVGGGGSGGNQNGGGGGGGQVFAQAYNVAPGWVTTITLGAGGLYNNAFTGFGTSGGNTTWGDAGWLRTAAGGNRGTYGPGSGKAGGANIAPETTNGCACWSKVTTGGQGGRGGDGIVIATAW